MTVPVLDFVPVNQPDSESGHQAWSLADRLILVVSRTEYPEWPWEYQVKRIDDGRELVSASRKTLDRCVLDGRAAARDCLLDLDSDDRTRALRSSTRASDGPGAGEPGRNRQTQPRRRGGR